MAGAGVAADGVYAVSMFTDSLWIQAPPCNRLGGGGGGVGKKKPNIGKKLYILTHPPEIKPH